MSDRPGGIATLTKHIAAAGASIKDIIHERSWLYHSVDKVSPMNQPGSLVDKCVDRGRLPIPFPMRPLTTTYHHSNR